MGSTVQVGGLEISSNNESAEDMVKALTPPEPKGKEPKVLVDRGRKVEEKPEDEAKASEAARELGKRGGEAAAKAREEKREAEAKAEQEAPKAAKEVDQPSKEAGQPEPKKGEGDPRHDPEARVKRATQEAADLRRQLEDERRARAEDRHLLMERLDRIEKSTKPAEPEPEEFSGRPRLKDFLGKHTEYEAAVEEWADKYFETRMSEREQQEQQRSFQTQQEQRIEKHVSGFRERMEKAVAADPDLLQRVDQRLLSLQTTFQAASEGKPIGPGEVLADLYTSSDYSAEVLLYLTEHEDEVVRLIKCESPAALHREFGKLEAKVARSKEAPAEPAPRRTVSNAPPPLRPVSTSATETEPDLFAEISYDEFRRRAGNRRR